jgi:hypothetical protein
VRKINLIQVENPYHKYMFRSMIFIFLGIFLPGLSSGNEPRPRIAVDPRIELVGILQTLIPNNVGRTTNLNFAYRDSVLKIFEKYKDHPAVRLVEYYQRPSVAFEFPFKAMLCVSDPFKMELIFPFPEDVIKSAGGEDSLKIFLDALQDFATQTSFPSFWEENQEYYQKLVANVDSTLQSKIISFNEGYYGIKLVSYDIILSPLLRSGGFGPHVLTDSGVHGYCILGPYQLVRGDISFGRDYYLANLIVHEFGHGVINPLTDEFYSQLEKYEKLYEPISFKMRMLFYGEWKTCFNEHLIRAITARYILKVYAKKWADERLVFEKEKGFIYIDPIYAELAIYEKNRKKYKTIQDFYPVLIDSFKKIKAETSRLKPEN